MVTALEVAQWMVRKLETDTYLYQEVVVLDIERQFGGEFVFTNENGNPAISRNVLKHFRKLTEGKVVWEKSNFAWRKIREDEVSSGRQID